MAFESGPYVQIAAFCEEVLNDNGVKTLRRVIDRLTATGGVDAPAEMPPVEYTMTLFLSLRSGRARGSHEVAIVLDEPSGLRKPVVSYRVLLEGEDRGVASEWVMNSTFNNEGLYWFDVLFDGELLTRVPFRIIYSRVA